MTTRILTPYARIAAVLLGACLCLPAWSALTVNAGNGTVTDSTTSLVWDQCAQGLTTTTTACDTGSATTFTWAAALTAASTANTAVYKGFSDWRLPNKNELESIVKIDSNPAFDSTAFPATPTGNYFWTSTTYAPVPSLAWIVVFGDGGAGADDKSVTYYVRLVRSGQPLASFDVLASADLSITKTDGVTTATPGGSLSYTITASNAGPSNAPGTTVADTLPAALSGATWTCVGAGGGTCTASGSGNINDTVNLPASGSVTYTLTATVSPAASGTLSNTATVTAASGITDPTPGNDSATDSDTLTAQADLSITKTDGVTTATPGGSVTYTITASNAGPSNASGSTVADTFPAALTATWTCVGAGGGTCTAAGSGNINDTVNLPAGGSVTYTVSATVSASASGTLSNTATVTAPGGITDPTPGNNSATDTDTLTAQADLSITKTDGVTTAVPGGSVTYTITASNAGPSNASGSTVVDTFPASLTATWTCVGAGGGTCTAAGSGNINDTVNLPAGGSVTYTASATVSASATGTLSNTATVTAPGGITDPIPGNNSATDSDTLTAQADLSITKTDGVTTVTPGGSLTYTITASNAGPSNASGSTVADTLPASLTGTWTCVGAGGGTCTSAGSGNINDSVNLPVGASVTYTVSATVSGSATGTLSNTATVTAPGGITDPTPGNNSATDTDTVNVQADLAVTLTDSPDPVTAGGNLTYAVTVSNAGPGAATTAQWSDTLPAGATFVSLTTAAGWSCTTPAVGSAGTVTCNMASAPAASSAAFSLVVTVASATPGGTVLTNTVTVSSATSDPTPGNNSATTTSTVAVVPPPPPPPEVSIPVLTISRACGLVTWPSIVNMGAGEGPAFTADMVTILSNVLSMPLRFVEQTAACGSVVLAGYNGGNLVFVPYGFLTGDNRPNGVYPVGNGQYQLVRNGQQITLAPALVHLEQLAALLPDVAATQLDTGAIIADVNGVRYVLQPGVAVQVGEPSGTAQLTMGADGLYRFVDALGNTQVLYPAFAEPTTLRRILQGLDPSATFNIALDGTATIDFNGQRYTLVPDLTLAPVPPEHAGQDWWQESATRYRLVNLQGLPVRSVSQGLTVKP